LPHIRQKMKEFDKKDIPALDFIIDELCKSSTFTFNTSDLKEGGFLDLIKDGYGSLTLEFDENIEFERLFSIIENFGCAKCVKSSPFGASAYIERTPETLQFKQQGGFKKAFIDLKEKRKREKIELKLAESNIKANKLNEKNAKFNKKISVINIVIGVINFVLALIVGIIGYLSYKAGLL